MSVFPKEEKRSRKITFNPDNLVETLGGKVFSSPIFKKFNSEPYDQKIIENREDVLTFTTEKSSRPLNIIGKIKGIIYVSTDTNDMDIYLRINDVHPNGNSYNLTKGILRGSFINSIT